MPGEESAGRYNAKNVEDGRSDDGTDPEVRFRDEGTDHVGEELGRARALKKREEKGGKNLRSTKMGDEMAKTESRISPSYWYNSDDYIFLRKLLNMITPSL